jgi:hypothetical protein
MFFKNTYNLIRSAAHSPFVQAAAARVRTSDTRIGCTLPIALAARAHLLVVPTPARRSTIQFDTNTRLNEALGFAAKPANRAGKTFARAALRAAYVGAPLTPTGYVVVASAIAVVLLIALASTLIGGDEPDPSMRLGWTAS